jgi:hypothetical protein
MWRVREDDNDNDEEGTYVQLALYLSLLGLLRLVD